MNDLVAALFAGDPTHAVPSVGVELELLPLRRDGYPPTIPTIETTAAATAGIADLTFEPGGQLELNPPPSPTAAAAIEQIVDRSEEARRRLDEHGIDLVAAGLEPWHGADEVPLQLTSDRYLAMDAHYAAIGPGGRCFMRQTASTQIGVGLRPGPAGRVQWEVGNLVAPLLAAAFANAPMREGRPVGDNGARTAIQREADPARHTLRWVGLDPAATYAAFARGARPIGPAFAGRAGAAAHLTTLFPPVRPRGTYLEVRSIDAVDGDDLVAAVTLTAALLASPRAAAAVLAAMERTEAADQRRWEAASGPGIRCDHVAAEVLALVEIAATEAVRDLPAGYLPADADAVLDRLGRRAAARRAPGDRSAPAPHRAGMSVAGAIR